MKKLLALFTLLILGLNASAQLAPVGTKWVYQTIDGDGTKAYFGRHETTIIKDTTIDGTIYSQFSESFYESFYTKENSKIYYFKNGEKLLFFDFDVKKGDSLYIDHFSTHNSEEILTKKYPIYINEISYLKTSLNDSLKVIKFKFKPRKFSSFSYGLIAEKILTHLNGTKNQPFDCDLIGSSPFEGGTNFKCYTEPNGFNFKLVNDCNKVGVKNIGQTFFEIYPNPVTNFLYIKNPKTPIESISIYNLLGVLVYNKSYYESAIDLQNIPSGVYFIEVKSNNEFYRKRIIKE